MKTPVTDLTDSGFTKAVLEVKAICLVDFWSPRCGTCHSMAPALEAFAAANEGKVHVYKLDVDDNPITSEKYEIKSTPTLVFFKDGRPIDVTRGTLSASSLQSKLEGLGGP